MQDILHHLVRESETDSRPHGIVLTKPFLDILIAIFRLVREQAVVDHLVHLALAENKFDLLFPGVEVPIA